MFGTSSLSEVDCRYVPVTPLPSACLTPCHDDALKDRSSMPPVSVTMHALKLAADAPPVGLLDDEGDFFALAHPATSIATAASAAAVRMVPLTVTSSIQGQPVVTREPRARPNPQRVRERPSLTGRKPISSRPAMPAG